MVDCFDRIAVQMTEAALEPVQLLRQSATLAAVTLRTPSGGRRYHITIRKFIPTGARGTPVFRWSIEEITAQGAPKPDGLQATSAEHIQYGDPEDAYWAAVDALASATRRQAQT